MLITNPKRTKRTSSDNNKVLLQAIQFGDEVLVKDIISADGKFHYNFSDQFGCTPVYYACRYGHLEILKILLDGGASASIVTLMHRTPLQIAAYHGHADCVKHLVNFGVNCDVVDAMGMTALHWAAENNHKDVVELLIQSGAELNMQNKFGKTPERLAFLKNNTSICQLFNKNTNYDSEFSNYSDDNENEDISDNSFSSINLPDSIPTNMSVIRNKLLESGLLNHLSGKDSGIKLLEQYGIRMLPDDESDLIVNALNCGQKAVLTEAGKLALQNTRPNIQDLFKPFNIVKNPKLDESKYLAVTSYTTTNNIPTEYDDVKVINSTVGEDDTLENQNLTWNEILPQTSCSEKTNSTNNNSTLTIQDNNAEKEEKEKLANRVNYMERELLRKLALSAYVIKCLKYNCEIHKREAELYKMQLQNVIRTLHSKNIPIDDILLN